MPVVNLDNLDIAFLKRFGHERGDFAQHGYSHTHIARIQNLAVLAEGFEILNIGG